MKRIGLSLIALTFALVLPLSSADAAGNGEWNRVGSYEMTYNYVYGFYDSPNVSSTGGDFKLEVSSLPETYEFNIELWESDPGSGNDDLVGVGFMSHNDHVAVFRSISSYVDGSNNRAEFYAKSNDPDSNHAWMVFFD